MEEKQLKARFHARLKPQSLLRKEDQDRRGGPGGSHAAVEGGTRATPVEPLGPVGKPAYLDKWHRLKMERSLKFLEEG